MAKQARELRVEALLGRRVHDADGKLVGGPGVGVGLVFLLMARLRIPVWDLVDARSPKPGT